MKEISLNILDIAENSVKAMATLTEITVNETDDTLTLKISDNGCGMTKEQISNIFRPFITYKSDGTGLGLAVTSEIIYAHHGQLKVSSVPGQGSTFCIYLNNTVKP